MKRMRRNRLLGSGISVVLLSFALVGCGSESEPLVLPNYDGEVRFGNPVVASSEIEEKELNADEIFDFGEGAGVLIEEDVYPEEARPKLPQGQQSAKDFDEVSLEMLEAGWVPSGRGGVPLLPPVQVGRGSIKVPENSLFSKEEYNNAFIKARSLAAKNLINTNIWRNSNETGLGEKRSGFMFLDASETGRYMTLEAQGKWYKDTENLGEKNSKSVEALKIFETLVSLPPDINGSWASPVVSFFSYPFESSVPSLLREGPQYPGSQIPSIVVGFTIYGWAGYFDESNKLNIYKVSRNVEYTMVKETTGLGGSADWFLWSWNNKPVVLEKLNSSEIDSAGFSGSYLGGGIRGGETGGNLLNDSVPSDVAEVKIVCDSNGANCEYVE